MNKPSKSKAEAIINQIKSHKYVERDTSAVIRCPICGKLISTRFPIHDCKPTDAETLRALQFALSRDEIDAIVGDSIKTVMERPEAEREILRCAPPFDAQAEHENDLRHESRVDYESWQHDDSAGREDQ